jgi:hypothetical protein
MGSAKDRDVDDVISGSIRLETLNRGAHISGRTVEMIFGYRFSSNRRDQAFMAASRFFFVAAIELSAKSLSLFFRRH